MPELLPELLQDDDDAKADAVMQAMLTMTKLDMQGVAGGLRPGVNAARMNSESLVRDFAERLPSTIELALVAFVAAALLGALVGYVRARVRAPALREVLSVPPLLARAMPVVILSLFLQIGMMVAGLPVALASSSDAFDLRDRQPDPRISCAGSVSGRAVRGVVVADLL